MPLTLTLDLVIGVGLCTADRSSQEGKLDVRGPESGELPVYPDSHRLQAPGVYGISQWRKSGTEAIQPER